MIRVTDVVKHHGTTRILDGATLEVGRGQLAVLVGPSGGGKSTLLRCVNGLEHFAAGAIAVGDAMRLSGGPTPPAKDTLLKLRRTVGMVFQQFNLFPHMTALQNVMSGPVHALGKPRAEAAETARRLLTRVGLGEKFDARPGQLSGGQQQRVAIARALAVNPAAILFDEPTSALDPAMAAEVLAVMRDLARDGSTTMIVVTHDREFARTAADVVFRMVAGKVVAGGAPREVLG